jgi:hypothetical protein
VIRSAGQPVSALLLTFGLCSAPAVQGAENRDTDAESSYTLITDFHGRPPFKRQRVSSSDLASLARFEETVTEPYTGRVRVTDYRGRPPFRRKALPIDEVADLARFEEASASSEIRPTRRGPPGKQMSRR